MKAKSLVILTSTAFLWSCSVEKQISTSAQATVLNDGALKSAHVGISIFEPATNKYWFDYQGDKYFVPASNTKLASCYAAMKYLGDSLVGLRYEFQAGQTQIQPTGDPTFLHPDFKHQPVFEFLKTAQNVSYDLDGFRPSFKPLGNGWAWNDYGDDYAPERSQMPIYGNVARFFLQADTITVRPNYFFNVHFKWANQTLRNGVGLWFTIERPFENNSFYTLYSNAAYHSKTKFTVQAVPFKTTSVANTRFEDQIIISLLEDTLGKKIEPFQYTHSTPRFRKVIHSQPTDSLLKLMMHHSDNFFAEQSLLMVSNEVLGEMNDARIIDTLLKTDFKDLPQKPRWTDGSGLSRYNLFTPQDFIAILNKIKNEFGMDRIKTILATGNTGTLSHYYVKDSSFIFAKTGTLSGVVALSGLLYTKKNKLLLFSVLVNNHTASATAVRRAVEKFIEGLREQY